MSHHWYTHKPKMILPVLDPPAAPAFPRVIPPRTPTVTPERSPMSAALEVCPNCGVGWRHGALERCWYCEI